MTAATGIDYATYTATATAKAGAATPAAASGVALLRICVTTAVKISVLC